MEKPREIQLFEHSGHLTSAHDLANDSSRSRGGTLNNFATFSTFNRHPFVTKESLLSNGAFVKSRHPDQGGKMSKSNPNLVQEPEGRNLGPPAYKEASNNTRLKRTLSQSHEEGMRTDLFRISSSESRLYSSSTSNNGRFMEPNFNAFRLGDGASFGSFPRRNLQVKKWKKYPMFCSNISVYIVALFTREHFRFSVFQRNHSVREPMMSMVPEEDSILSIGTNEIQRRTPETNCINDHQVAGKLTDQRIRQTLLSIKQVGSIPSKSQTFLHSNKSHDNLFQQSIRTNSHRPRQLQRSLSYAGRLDSYEEYPDGSHFRKNMNITDKPVFSTMPRPAREEGDGASGQALTLDPGKKLNLALNTSNGAIVVKPPDLVSPEADYSSGTSSDNEDNTELIDGFLQKDMAGKEVVQSFGMICKVRYLNQNYFGSSL